MKWTLYILLIVLFVAPFSYGQTLIVNEVSQGASGNMEYVELVVVDTTAFYDCGTTTPPCIDIRGWIFDDNSGYHGTGGVAAGANRFSYDPLWSCIELGTVILIYNDADPNPLVPADDLVTSDGNCAIVAPISNSSLFEFNSTTPGAVACSYPTTGWNPGGDWTTTLLANGGDCARIVDTAGCEVFSVCWGSNNLNTVIYFSGGSTSATSATNTVYYFNGTDPTDQANWSIGCADVPACGVEEQTPGTPNNAANMSYIGQFNNNCIPISPLSGSVIGNNDCSCNGSATASATGSIPGYTYEWTDNLFIPIGQTGNTATGLCSGDYNMIVTSSIGCEDTVLVTIANTVAPTAGTGLTINLCSTDPVLNLFDSLSGSPDASGSWNGPSPLTGGSLGTFDPLINTSGDYEYLVGAGTTCADSAEITIALDEPAIFNPGPDSVCIGQSVFMSVLNIPFPVWSNFAVTDTNVFTVNSDTIMSVTGTNNCGSFSFSDTITVVIPPIVSISPFPIDSICVGDTIQALANYTSGASNFAWSTSETSDTLIISTAGSYHATVDAFCGSISSDTLTVSVISCGTPTSPNPPIDVTLPNVFTPNQDGSNEAFKLVDYINITNVSGIIFNRWGQILYNFNGLDDSWDGRTMSGELVPEGTYFYALDFIDINMEEFTRKGHFLLIRNQ